MIYLDSSALLKLLFEERESAALAAWIAERTETPMVSSELAKVEVVRATRRLDTAVVPAARALVSQLDLIRLSSGLIGPSTPSTSPAPCPSATSSPPSSPTTIGYSPRPKTPASNRSHQRPARQDLLTLSRG
jgi:hypothetical protein